MSAPSASVDIGGNGPPTIAGSLGGSIGGGPSQLDDLQVTINFGEVSPLNASGIVRAVVPVAIRATKEYEVRMSIESPVVSADPQALQLSDIGFGIQNLAPYGAGAAICTAPHTLYAPFDNDPSATVDVTDRASYPSTLANIAPGTLLLSGPKLSRGPVSPRKTDNGWGFDAIFTVVPQFYSPGTTSVTVRFTIVDATFTLKCQ